MKAEQNVPLEDGEKMNLGTPRQVVMAMAARALAFATLGATCIAAVLLFDLPRLLILLVAPIGGWLIYSSSYFIPRRVEGQRLYLDMWWSHAILIVALLFGGIWTGLLSVAICGAPQVVQLGLLASLPSYCSEASSTARVFISGMVISAVFLSAVPGFVLGYLCTRRSSRG